MSEPKRYLSGHILLRPPAKKTWYMAGKLPDGSHFMRAIGPAWKSTGRCPDGYFTANTAQQHLDAFLAQYKDLTRGSNPTFNVAADEYLAYLGKHRELRASTLRRYRQIMATDLKPRLGEKHLSDISKRTILDLREELSNRPGFRRGAKEDDEKVLLSASTLNQTRTLLIGVYKFAKRVRGYSGPDPSIEFERAKVKKSSHIDVYSPAEVLALGRAAENEQDAALFVFAGFSGLRRSELRSLRWRDVDFAKSTIFVRGGYTDEGGHGLTKSGKGRSVPLIAQAAKPLEDLSRRERFTGPDDLVFCTAVGGVLDGAGMFRRFQAAAAKAGLRVLRFHSLRHSYGSMGAQVWPITDLKQYMGHSSIQTTLIYIHFKEKSEAASQLSALIDADVNLMTELEAEMVVEEIEIDD